MVRALLIGPAMKRSSAGVLASVFSLALWGCGAPEDSLDFDDVKTEGVDGKADSSSIATIVDAEFDGSLVTNSSFGLESVIRDQMLYTIGHLNHNNSVGRLDKLVLTNIKKVGNTVTYHAKMPVAWGSKTNIPTKYTFKLPKNADDYAGFTTKYSHACVDSAAHDVDVGSMWYYYRPFRSGCTVAATDVVQFDATFTVSSVNTNGKYPEYHKVWEDNAFKVVAIFGKYEDGATTASDAGIAAYNTFVRAVRTKFPSATITPALAASASPGVANPDVELKATLADGKTVQVNILLVDNVASATTTFYNRYNTLSSKADLIAYNGHAGLGQNVRALARKGAWVAGQYVMVFMNGCDTYAYVDGYLADARRSLNTDDATGTKYLDFIVNAMPSYFHEDSNGTMQLINAMVNFAQPMTYQNIFNNIDTSQVVLVSGEQDNVYYPGYGNPTTPPTGGLIDETADVDANEELQFVTGELEAGAYTVTLSADGGDTGDADLYVKTGAAPSKTVYDCRPYVGGSAEECKVTLTAKNKIYVMVHGYTAAKFKLKITKDGSTGPVTPTPWAGLNQTGSVAKNQEVRFETPLLAAGSYTFTLSGATGDADLYVRTNAAPTTAAYDCRPYKSGSNEVCTMSLAAPAVLHVMVRGYSTAASPFTLVGAKN